MQTRCSVQRVCPGWWVVLGKQINLNILVDPSLGRVRVYVPMIVPSRNSGNGGLFGAGLGSQAYRSKEHNKATRCMLKMRDVADLAYAGAHVDGVGDPQVGVKPARSGQILRLLTQMPLANGCRSISSRLERIGQGRFIEW